jgi:hypothetical protein
MRQSSIAAALAAVLLVAGASLGPPATAQTGASAQAAQLSEGTVRALQQALNEQGMTVPVDGVLGEATYAAIRQYQSQHHLPVTGEPDAATLEKLGISDQRSGVPGDSPQTGTAAVPGGQAGMPGRRGMGGGMTAPQGMMGPGMMGGQAQMPGMMGTMPPEMMQMMQGMMAGQAEEAVQPGMMMGPGMMGGQAQMPGMMGMAPGQMAMMRGGMAMPGGMMMCPMMAGMMGPHPGMMGMHRGMMPMASGAMGMMGPHMMGPGMMMGMGRGHGAMAMFGVVRPSQRLSADDVRHHFERHLEWMGNPRLQIGDVTEVDERAIAAEIVTVDGALVDRLNVDRHTGMIQRAE